MTSRPDLVIIAIWSVFMVFPFISSYLIVKNLLFSRLLIIWPLIVVLGMILNFSTALELSLLMQTTSYGTFWFVLSSFGFLYTSLKFEGGIRALYILSAILNILSAVVFHLYTVELLRVYYMIAAVVQGVPMLIHALIE